MTRRVNIKTILADPVKRREMAIRFIMTAQAMEGIDTTREQAERAIDTVANEVRRTPCESRHRKLRT